MSTHTSGRIACTLPDIQEARTCAWNDYADDWKRSPQRREEMESLQMRWGDAVMRFAYTVVGEPLATGYPLYIALHGGGATEINEQQWRHMQQYYLESVNCGIYLAVRGVRDTWNTHFNSESFPLYDRLIQNCVVFLNADPNRVYLMGFSAGGDGVYGVSPRMADRFAAVSMSAGHPNGIDLSNLYNTPILLQCGEQDTAYDRHLHTARYALELQERGYPFAAYLHRDKGHHFADNDAQRAPQAVAGNLAAWLSGGDPAWVEKNTNAVDFLAAHTRNPLPQTVVWDLSTRADSREIRSFYWLRAARSACAGKVRAWYDRLRNTVSLEWPGAAEHGALTVLLNEAMLDVCAPVTLIVNGTARTAEVSLDRELLRDTTAERGDRHYQFVGTLAV
jgi:dienelactone hydrolase